MHPPHTQSLRAPGNRQGVWDATSAIAGLGRKRFWELAVQKLVDIRKHDLEPNVVLFSATVNACTRSEQWRPAMQLLVALCCGGIKPSVSACNAAISACGKSGAWEQALRTLAAMGRQRVEEDLITLNAAISACSTSGRWDSGLQLLNKPALHGLELDIVTFSAGLSGCEREGRWQAALHLLSVLPERRLRPDKVVCNTAISACGRGGQPDVALQLLQSIQPQWKLHPDVVSFGAAVNACENAGWWQEALSLLCELDEARLELDVRVCTAAIGACGRGGEWQKALQLLGWMQLQRVNPNVVTLGIALTACDVAARWEMALHLFRWWQATAELNIATCVTALSVLGRCGQWQRCLQVLSELTGLQSEGSLVLSNVAISACSTGFQWERALELLHSLSQRSSEPDLISFCTTMAACNKAARWEHALAVFLMHQVCPLQPDNQAYGMAVTACEMGARWEQGLNLLNLTQQMRVSPYIGTYSAAIRTCVAADQSAVAGNLVRSIASTLPHEPDPLQACCGLTLLGQFTSLAEDSSNPIGGHDESTYLSDLMPSLLQPVQLAGRAIPRMSTREVVGLLWSLACLDIPLPLDLRTLAEKKLAAKPEDLTWQDVAYVDAAFRGLPHSGLNSCGHNSTTARFLQRSGEFAMAAANCDSDRRNAAPAELLLALDGMGPPGPAGGAVLVVDDPVAAAGLEARGCRVRRWERMSSRPRTGEDKPPAPEVPCTGGAVVRLFGVQSNRAGAALRLAVAGAAALLPVGAPLWLCGREDEGIEDAPLALQGLFSDAVEVARGREARVFQASKISGACAPDLQTFRGSTTLPLSEIGLEDIHEWHTWPGLFAGGALDAMTAFLLQKVMKKNIEPNTRVLDFCCGSGVIAQAVLEKQPRATVHLADADALAMQAAINNVAVDASSYYLGDGWDPVPADQTFDLIISNPPVHRRRQDDFHVLEELVAGSRRHLSCLLGELWIVAQVLVPVGPLLERHGFDITAEGNCRFTVWRARLPPVSKDVDCTSLQE